MNHPQTVARTGVGTIATLLVWAAHRYGVDLGPVEGAAAATAMIAAGAFIGRRGLRGLGRLVWSGNEDE